MKNKKRIWKYLFQFIYLGVNFYIKVGIILMVAWIMLRDFKYLVDNSWFVFWSIIGLYWIVYPLFKHEVTSNDTL